MVAYFRAGGARDVLDREEASHRDPHPTQRRAPGGVPVRPQLQVGRLLGQLNRGYLT